MQQSVLHENLTRYLQNMKQIVAEDRDLPLVRVGEHMAWALRDLGEYSTDAEVKELTEQIYKVYRSIGNETIVQSVNSEEGQ